MSQYFSRLAERSGVTQTASPANSRHSNANASEAWGEQTAETMAVRDANFPVNERMTKDSDGAFFTPSIDDSHSSLVAGTDVPTENFETQENQTISESQKNGIAFPKKEYTPPSEKSPMSLVKKNLVAALPNLKSENVALPSQKNLDEATNSNETNISATSENNASIASTPSKKISLNNLQAKTNKYFQDDSAADTPRQSISSTGETALEHHQQYQANMSPKQRAQALERIESNPVHSVATATLEKSLSSRASSSSIQVHIGKIELEIHASAATPARTPALPQVMAPAISPRPKSASFNPHRHYLRTR